MYSKKRHVYICEDCGGEFTLEGSKSSRRIFISHMPDDPFARCLRKDLITAGYELWPEPDMGADPVMHRAHGLDWVAETRKSGRFIVLMTPESVRRPDGHCLNDVAQAVQKKIPIIPIMLSGCDMPLSICRIQRIDLMDCLPIEDHREKYVERLRLIIETIEEEGLDYKNVQSRLLRVLEPLPFDVDIQRHLARFTGRQWIFKRVDNWLADLTASRIFWIVGAPGVGKTAIASWLAFNRPEVAAFHLCRHGDIEKSDPRRAILSIAYQLSTQLPDYQDRLNALNLEKIARESNAKTLFDMLIIQPLSGNFPPPEGAIVILIDALDEATRFGKNDLADLIASEFGRAPAWLRLVITSRPEPEVLHPLQGLTPSILDTADPQNDQDIREFLARELRPYADEKEVPAEAIDTISTRSEGIFLYVEWIRQELAQKRLSLSRLDEFPRGLAGVYSQFFSRQYPEIARYRTRISPALEIMASALEPLKLSMFVSVFRWDEYQQADFTQELGGLFPITDGKISPFHRSVIEWLTDSGKASQYYIDVRNGHLRLADYGWQEYRLGLNKMSDYMLAHLPAHLISTERWNDAVSMLTDLSYFNHAWNANEFTVESYWTQIEGKSGIALVDAYAPIVNEPSKYVGQSQGVADLLYSTSHYPPAQALYDYLIPYHQMSGDLKSLKNAYDKKGMILAFKGDNAAAMEMLKEEERICRELGDRFGLQDVWANQVVPLLNIGDMEGINKIAREMERNSELMNKRQYSRILHVKGLMLAETGKLDEALKVYREKEKICNELKDVQCLYMTYNNSGLILYEKGDYDEALALNKKFEKLCVDHGSMISLSHCLLNFAFIYHDIGDIDRALEMLRRAEEISRQQDNKLIIYCTLGIQAVVYHDIGKLDQAVKLHEEELAICNEQKDKLGIHYALGNLALIDHDRGMLDRAMERLEEKKKLTQGASIVRSVQAAIGDQALIFFDRGELDEATRLHKEEESMCRQLGNKKELAICALNQANVLYARGRNDEALRQYTEAEGVFRKMNYWTGLIGCLNGEAMVYSDRGELDGALKCLGEARDISSHISYKKGLQATLTNLAAADYRKGDYQVTAELLKEAENLGRELDYKQGLAISLLGQAILLAREDKHKAGAIAREGCAMIDGCGIKILGGKAHAILGAIEDTGSTNTETPKPILWVFNKQKQDKNS
jgi:tetratricopeptide (TPR) repeat protein